MAYPTTITCRRCAPTMAPRQTSYAASGMTASANGEVVAGSMYWLTSRTSRSTCAVSCDRREASRPGWASCASAPLDTHLESIGSSLPPGKRSASSTTLPPTQTLRCSISGGRWRRASSRIRSPAAPRLELPAMTLSIRFKLARASSSIGWRAEMAERKPSIAELAWARPARISAACVSWVWPPDWSRAFSSATSRACPSARRTRLQTSAPTTAVPAMRDTRSSANNSSSNDILGILALIPGINKPVNMSSMAEIKPLREPDQAPDRIPLEEVYMRMAEELAKRSTCARLQVGTVITTPDLTQVLGIGYNGNARGLPNRCDSTTPGACGCIHSEMNALVKAGARVAGKVMFVSASPCVMCAKMAINANVARVYFRETYRDPASLDTLRQGGVEVIQYNRWRDLWR